MVKLVISLIVAVALCYFAEGATEDERQSQINIITEQERQVYYQRLIAAIASASAAAATPEQRACTNAQKGNGFRQINISMNSAKDGLRAQEYPDLSSKTPEELGEEMRPEIQETMEPIIRQILEGIAAC